MKMKELTLKESCSVACPTCGVAAGKQCVLHSGGARSGPHMDRKLFAAEVIEEKRMQADGKPSVARKSKRGRS